ncbi:hypothetical protein GCM10010985_59290 [Caballeronia grimmiae]|uniref:Uncharacterized protein n=1 Tax=Caballeronia grimmiae TaxID=1071679 RepID=A0ABQ1S9R3_9BURK|nr:hypothetical protein GCM10010985_59290 [Caballeronia grimmiae]
MNLGVGGVIQADHETFVRNEVEGRSNIRLLGRSPPTQFAKGGVERGLPVSFSVPGKQAAVTIARLAANAIQADSIESGIQDGYEPQRCMVTINRRC